MNSFMKFTVLAFLAFVANASISQAQIRDAASKILGNYDHFDQSSQARYSPGYSVPRQSMPAVAQSQSETRSFSYDSSKQVPNGAATQRGRADQATSQSAPSQSVRRFSYDPAYSAPRRAYAPSRSWQGGARSAGSKALGEY
jgi:hypothetical protein